jgi:tetratricopeptide (TPR) repeat protein
MKVRVIFLLLAVTQCAARAGDVENAIAVGRSARADGVPQAAIYDLERVAAQSKTPDALIELARCLLAAGREEEAVEWLQHSPYGADPAVIFWTAQALAQKGDYAGALRNYSIAAKLAFPLQDEARIGRARMLDALGEPEGAELAYLDVPAGSKLGDAARLAASQVLIGMGRDADAMKLLVSMHPRQRVDREMQRYLKGRIALDDGDTNRELRNYSDFHPGDRRLAAGAEIGEADAIAHGGEQDRAQSKLESFISEHPDSPWLLALFAKLDEIRAQQKDAPNSALKEWENDTQNRARSALSTYYLARNDERQSRIDHAIRSYGEFIARYPDHPLHLDATMRMARLLLGEGRVADAAAALNGAEARANTSPQMAQVKYLEASVQYLSGDRVTATKNFIAAADLDSSIAEQALANAALGAIATGNEPLEAEILNALHKQNAQAALRVSLADALSSAKTGRTDAGMRLGAVAKAGGVTGDQGWLALAEWHASRGEIPAARTDVLKISNASASGVSEQKDYFAVYLADDGSTRVTDQVARAAQAFLDAHPDSPHEAAVRMKWGEVLMRAGDYRGARVQFDQAGRSTDDPGIRQSALFLAARAAAGSMDPDELDNAIALLEEVAGEDKTSPLAGEARLEQAILQSALNRPGDSVKTLDSLIASTKDPRMQIEARMKKGEALLALGAKDPNRVLDAIQTWRDIATDTAAQPSERNQALTLAASASEQRGDIDGALAGYYEVLSAPRDKQPEYFWYYKAGFEAANILIDRKRYKEAAAIYQKMADSPGPRAAEFSERVKRLRLENFIWED